MYERSTNVVAAGPGVSAAGGPAVVRVRGGLGGGYPARQAVAVLEHRVTELLTSGAYAVGDRFLTDDEVVAATGLSRSTVRRALRRLRDQGWLRSQAGLGTFVGRVGAGGNEQASLRREAPVGTLRLGVMAFSPRTPAFDWLTPAVMQGVQDVAAALGARVELLSGLHGPVADALRDLEHSGLDAVVCLSADPQDALVVRAASERGVRCLIGGTMFPELSAPRVCEDNRGGMDRLVREVAALGHERIGLVMRRWLSPWLFKRHEQWHDTRRALGLPLDEALMHWLPQADGPLMAPAAFNELADWIAHARPTAIICGHYPPALHLGQLLRTGRLRCPQDVSLAVIDQHPEVRGYLGTTPATLAVPLREIGQELVRLAAAWCAGQEPPSLTRVPMRWTSGTTLAQPMN